MIIDKQTINLIELNNKLKIKKINIHQKIQKNAV